MNNNPFNISFGKKPHQYISRFLSSHKIKDTFLSDYPSSQTYLITGVRGSGKTVLMTELMNDFRDEKDWIVVELNPEMDLLEDLASKLYNISSLRSIFLKAKIDLSVFGLGVNIEKGMQITNIETAIEQMLKELKKKKKKVLIAIDEVTNRKNVRVFASAFQIFIRQEYDLFLIMTGLYENIFELQNEKTLTFLYRAPKIVLDPLNAQAITLSYKDIFDISEEEAATMSRATNGFAFAYQALGYIKWEHKTYSLDRLYPEYDQYLAEFVYDKVWMELSPKDREVIKAMAGSEENRVADLLEKTGMSSSLFSTYRDRLSKKGLINTQKYGYVSLSLPRFREYAVRKSD